MTLYSFRYQYKKFAWEYLGSVGTYDLTKYNDVKIGIAGDNAYLNTMEVSLKDAQDIGVTYLRTTVPSGNSTSQATLSIGNLSSCTLGVLGGTAHIWAK